MYLVTQLPSYIPSGPVSPFYMRDAKFPTYRNPTSDIKNAGGPARPNSNATRVAAAGQAQMAKPEERRRRELQSLRGALGGTWGNLCRLAIIKINGPLDERSGGALTRLLLDFRANFRVGSATYLRNCDLLQAMNNSFKYGYEIGAENCLDVS